MDKELQRVNLKDKAYAMIREKIVNCEYMPNCFLNEAQLTELVGVSRTPIREAINKLEQEGLVKILPKRGIMVSDITIATVNDTFEVRLLLEPYLIENYGKNISEDQLKYQMEIAENDSVLSYKKGGFEKDNEFHQMFFDASHNSYFKGIMHQIYALNQRIRILSGLKSEERLKQTQKEHQKILYSLLEKKYQDASNDMKEHLMNSKKAALTSMLNDYGKNL